MKKQMLCLTLCVFFLFGCTPRTERPPTAQTPAASPTPAGLQWEILPPEEPMPVPTPELAGAEERGFFEIDIDKADAYRDFAAEYMYMDTWYETVLYRLKDDKYIELGRLEGTLTGNVGYRIPNITLDGTGGVYCTETSALASWADLYSVYEVKDDAIALKNGGNGIREFNDPPVFRVTEATKLRGVDYAMWKSFGGSVEDYLTNDVFTLERGDTVTFFASDENSALLGSFGGNYGVLIMEGMDILKNGPFFGSCFYSERVEWVG